MTQPFEGFDFANFWNDCYQARLDYIDKPLTDPVLARVEAELGYALPPAYVALMRRHNGGIPKALNHRAPSPTSWSHDHIAITGIFGIGPDKALSLTGGMGSRFWIDQWGYPAIGVYFADCPSAGHDMLCLDYRACGPHGEPQVVHVDQAYDYRITRVADNFEAFIRGLEGEAAFEEQDA